MLYNIHYDVCAIVVFALILLLIRTGKGLTRTSNWVLFLLVIAEILSTVADIVSSYYISFPHRAPMIVMDFWNYAFLVSHNVMPCFFAVYVIFLTGVERRMSKLHWTLLFAPVALSLITLFSNIFLRLTFYYDENGMYTHGPLFAVLYVDTILYLLISLMLILRFRRALPISKVVALLVTIALFIVPVLIQFFFPYLLIEMFFQSVGVMCVLFTIENQDEIVSPITGVFNRFAFLRAVDAAIYTNTPIVILTVKVFNLNHANATLGVQYMNHVQKEMALWLNAQFKQAACYDCDGGHFALLMRGADKERLKGAAERVRERFDLEWAYEALSVVFPAQICLLEVPNEIRTIDQLMLAIDVPVEDNASRSVIITSDALHSYQRETLIEQKILEALDDRTIQVYYQPIWDRKTGQIKCAEALVRMIDEDLGYISPEEFIPIAERNGTIMDIGAFVLEDACRFYEEQRLNEIGVDYLEVNLSVVQCMNRRLPRMIQDILASHNLKPERINLEITESAAAGNKTALEKTVRELAGRGFSLSLDDYGTGYSNYSYMFALPFKIIKIDKSILWSAIGRDDSFGEESAMILLENTIRMLEQMKYRVVIEGVETEMQKEMLERLGCDYMQGFLFSKPLPKEGFVNFVKKFNNIDGSGGKTKRVNLNPAAFRRIDDDIPIMHDVPNERPIGSIQPFL